MSSPPIASVLSITAGRSGGMVDGPGGAGCGLPIWGGASAARLSPAAAEPVSASAINRAWRSLGIAMFPYAYSQYLIRNGTFTAMNYRRMADRFDDGLQSANVPGCLREE